MATNNNNNGVNAASTSTDDIHVGENTALSLTEHLSNMEDDIAGKAPNNHSHADLVAEVEAMVNNRAEADHRHEMTEINGLTDALTELEEAIAEAQNGGGSAVAPMLTLSMHLGKLDNNSGAENASSTRICSDPFAVEPGNTYYQVNDKGVNMYVLLYDADEVFLQYLGNFASGAAIEVTNENAAYMRLGSLLGEYDLTNEFRIYDVDPASGGSSEGGAAVDAYSKEEADERFAPQDHTHDNDHAHSNKAVLDGITAEKVAEWNAGTSSGGGYVHPETHPASMITGLADVATTGDYNDLQNKPTIPVVPTALPANGGNADTVDGKHADDFAPSNHSHSGYSPTGHVHNDYLPKSGGTINGALTVMQDSIYNGVLNTQKIQPKDSGSYSIGTADNRYYSAYLRVNPNVSSDRRRKRDIADLNAEKLAEFVNRLPVVSFNYNDDAPGAEKKIGVIAQEVIAADPEVAKFFVEQDGKGFYSVRPADFVFPLIAAVQELSKKVAMLEGGE